MELLAILLLMVMAARSASAEPAAPPTRPFFPGLLPEAPPSAPPTLPKAAAKVVPPPWPQSTPGGLPPFGPSGWQPDEPPPLEVQTRAVQLLPVLWKYGAGTHKTEKTGPRWITYQAQHMGKKKGVVAFRVRDDVLQNQPPTPDPAASPLMA